MNFIWIFRENAAVVILHFSTALWVTLKFEMQERSRTFCLFVESLLKFRPTFYDQFTFETAIAIVNTPNYKYYHEVSKVKIVYRYIPSFTCNINTEYISLINFKSLHTGILSYCEWNQAPKIDVQWICIPLGLDRFMHVASTISSIP